jgi:hypothetical protein
MKQMKLYSDALNNYKLLLGNSREPRKEIYELHLLYVKYDAFVSVPVERVAFLYLRLVQTIKGSLKVRLQIFFK